MVLTAAALCTSCSTDNLAEQQQQGQQTGEKAVSLTATMDEAVTRAGIGKDATVAGKALCYWHKGDQILVQTKTTEGKYSGAKFFTTDATGSTTATFWGESLSGATLGGYALYPYNEKHQFADDGKFIYNLPATYTYTTVGQEIFSNTEDDGTNTYPTNSTNVPMLGTIDSENNSIHFSHIGGLVVIRIDKMPFEAGTLTVSADQQLSGNFAGDVTTTAAPVIATTSTDVAAADKQVIFIFSGATADGVGVFYLPIATGEYTNLTIKISDSDAANTQTIPYGTLTATAAANVWAISLTTHNGKLWNCQTLGKNRYKINGHVFVDLGLPSGLLWAETNIGASTAKDAGNYYAWGEVTAYGEKKDFGDKTVKTTYGWSNYKYGTSSSELTKYTSGDEKTILDKEDDAAYVNWGSFCRMPTGNEIDELGNKCDWTWTAVDGVNGCTVKSKTKSSSIFLPVSGMRDNSDFILSDYGYCWSSTLSSEPSCAYNLYFDSGDYYVKLVCDRCTGLPIRPVAEPKKEDLKGETAESMNSNGFFEGWE